MQVQVPSSSFIHHAVTRAKGGNSSAQDVSQVEAALAAIDQLGAKGAQPVDENEVSKPAAHSTGLQLFKRLVSCCPVRRR